MNLNIIKIGWSKESGEYYLWGEVLPSCNVCHEIIDKLFMLNTLCDPLFDRFEQRAYCPACFERVKKSIKGHGSIVPVLIGSRPFDIIPVIPDTLVTKPVEGRQANVLGGYVMSAKEIAADMDNPQVSYDVEKCKVAFDNKRNIQVEVDDGKRLGMSAHPIGIDWANCKRTKKEGVKK